MKLKQERSLAVSHLKDLKKLIDKAIREANYKKPQFNEELYYSIVTYATYAFTSCCVIDRLSEED